ncbi:hypothetical protein BWQ96_03488 [Gracilariopsis chorda]|uniref:Uncharacterized protein n=1 Tax=Gracilariopsis chorda TaxID=448386 RepID=A0A2V3IYN7_9FLOR|nr:hypothetical protein BWQ96_03488 [Gracilariopsis chorda]|eukprot:PXF46797.1 hypothetical protein BWQ96_03488 [Gracilariopsis chorda]
MSSSSHHQAALERLVAQLDLLQSRLRVSVNSHPPRSPSPPVSAPPSVSLFPFSMPFQSELDDVQALDKFLHQICERTFGARPSAQSSLHPHQPHRRRPRSAHPKHTTSRTPTPEPSHRPNLSRPKSAKSHSPTSSSPPASHPPSRTPKHPRTPATPTNLRSSRPPPIALRSVPVLTTATNLRSARVDAPNSSTSAKHALVSIRRPSPKSVSASHDTQSQSVILRLRIKPSRDYHPSDQQPSQSSNRTRTGGKRPRHLPEQQHKLASEDEQKPIPASRKHRASTTSPHTQRHARDSMDETPSSESRRPANREKNHPQEKLRNRQHQKRSDKHSAVQSNVPLDSQERTRSHHSSESVPRSSARRRRKAHIITTDSDDEGHESDNYRPRPRSPREYSRKPGSGGHSDPEKPPTHTKSPQESPAQPPPTTLQSPLSFAHKSMSLSRALCHHHKKALDSMQMSYEDQIISGKVFDALSYDIEDDQWQQWITEDKSNDTSYPPGLSKSLDAVQFMLRLLEETVDSEEEVAGKVMQEWYERGLTTELANWMLTALKFWSAAKHHEGEHDENYSELVDWIIRLSCSIITYELSPSSLIYKVKNLQADNMFISTLRVSCPEKAYFLFTEY